MKVETKLELETAMFEFKGGAVTMNLKGRLHPLGYSNPDAPTFYAQKTFRSGEEDEILERLVVLLETEFGRQVKRTSDQVESKKGGKGEADTVE